MDTEMWRESAIGFVQRNGTPLQCARLLALQDEQTIHHGEPLSQAILAAWRRGRNQDGGWTETSLTGHHTDLRPLPSSVSGTARALRYARELNLGVLPEVRTGLLWLAGHQRDGAIADDDSILSGSLESPRLSLADEGTVAFLTALALRELDLWVQAVPTFTHTRERAYDWLSGHEWAWKGQHPRTVWLTASAALRREGTTSALGIRALAHLTADLSSSVVDLTAGDLAELVLSLVEAGWPAGEPPVSRGIALLPRLQRNDGAFSNGQEDDVEGTLAAVRALSLVHNRVPR